MIQMRSYVGSAVTLTVVIWLFASMTMLGPVMGDCLPEMGHSCPTDRERNLTLLCIALAAVGTNVAAVWLLVRLRGRDAS